VISVGTFANPSEPVETRRFSTTFVHRRNGRSKRDHSVFPLVHTPYDFYERI
jgi:hypothetical protein